MQVVRKKNKEHGKWKTVKEKRSNRDGFIEDHQERNQVEAGGPYRMLKAEFAWLDDLFMGARVRCKQREQQGDENDSQEKGRWYHYGQYSSCS